MGQSKKTEYKTKQRDELLEILQQDPGAHMTVAEIAEKLKANGASIGIATIYRQLDKFVNDGLVTKYILGPRTSACFTYNPPEAVVHEEFHFKCVRCDRLIHIRCDELAGIQKHLLKEHHLLMDPKRTVLYGLCEACRKDAQSQET